MKTSKLILGTIALMGLFLVSCGGDAADTSKIENSETPSAPPNADNEKVTKFDIDIEKSSVTWKGYILNVKEHTGTLKLKSGGVKMKGTDVIGGGLVIDMNSMVTTDSNYDEENSPEGLIGHLKSPDFFDVGNFPVASVIFNEGGSASVTIKKETNKEAYSELKMTEVKGGKVLTAKMTFDRQNYGVEYKGSSKDYLINDQIEVVVTLVTK